MENLFDIDPILKNENLKALAIQSLEDAIENLIDAAGLLDGWSEGTESYMEALELANHINMSIDDVYNNLSCVKCL